jgi:hypothetical protein
MHPDVQAQLQQLPGLSIMDTGMATNIEIPIHGWLVIKPYLDWYFQHNPHHQKLESLGPPRRKGRYDAPSLRRFPPNLNPARIPGLNEEALRSQRPCQIASWRRLFQQGCTLEEIPTGGGKTFVALGAACAAAALGWKVLILAPTSAAQWEAEMERWITPGAIKGFTVLRGQLGCEVRTYAAKSTEVFTAIVSQREAEARLPARTRLGKLELLWDETGTPRPQGVPAKEIPVTFRTRALDLRIVEQSTRLIRPARWVIWDGDTNKPIKMFEEGFQTWTVDENGQGKTLGPAEAAEMFIRPLNKVIRADSQILVASSGILTARRDALRTWAPDLVICDESHDMKHWEVWKRVPPATPGDKPVYILHETQAASAYWVTERASAVMLLSATPDPDRRRDLFAQYSLCDPKGWGNFRSFSGRYCGGRMREVQPGVIVWDSTGEVKRGVPIPIDPVFESELRQRAAYVHAITPRSESHKDVPPIDRRLVWLKPSELSRPGKDPDWSVPIRSAKDITNRLLDIAAEMKRKPAVAELAPRILSGQKGIVLTGSHASCDRLEAEFRKKLCEKDHILTQRECTRLREIWQAALGPSDPKPPHVEPGQLVHPLVLASHGGTGDREDRYGILTQLLLYPGPALLVGTVDAWGQGWDRMQFLDFGTILRLPWNQGKVLQAEGRFERGRGLYSVLVEYFLASGTIDERLLRTVLGKADASLRLFNRDDLSRLRAGLAEEESEEDILASMLDGLLGKNGQPVIQLGTEEDDAEDFQVDQLVSAALERGNDRENL